jgi:hypothetical protein
MDMNIVEVELANLKNWEKNARKTSPRGLVRLKEQIITLGLYKPMVGYKDGDGKVVILGGNTRLRALRELSDEGYKKIDYSKIKVCLVAPQSEEEKLKINMSDNDNVGNYDVEMFNTVLNSFDFTKIETGIFQVQSADLTAWLKHLERQDQKSKEPESPPYPVTKQLHEKYNYVVIVATNDTDLAYLEEFFQLEKHQSHKFTKWVGITRVVGFDKFNQSLEKRYGRIYENSNPVDEQSKDDSNAEITE